MPIIGAKPGTKLPTRSETRHPPLAEPPADELALALKFARAEKSEASRRAYRSDFQLFSRWCDARNLSPLPATPATLAAFLACEARRGSRPSSIARRIAGIRHAHLLADHPPPTNSEMVRATLRGIRRTIGTAPKRKAPLTADQLRAMVAAAPDSLIGLRDRALLLVGFAGALRRSELVGLDVADLTQTKAGLRLRIRSSKTDQEQQGTTVAIARGNTVCPIAALNKWLTTAGMDQGPVFRPISKGRRRVSNARLSDRAVAEIVKSYAKRIGLDPTSFGGHSLRSGFLTSAARRGASIFKMKDISRHRNLETLSGYVRDAEFFTDHAGAGLL
jgi:site-specific recombinase XerD